MDTSVGYDILFSSPGEDGTPITPSVPSNEEGESSPGEAPLVAPAEETRVYGARYWVLFIYSLILFFQCMVWNTWGPISESALYAFSWDDSTIAALSNWGPIGMLVMVIPASYLIDRWGLRPTTVGLTGLCVVGHGLRCITSEPTIFTIMAHVCGATNGILATIILASASVPALWFPAAQRVTATAFSTVVNQMGAGGSFLEPLLVRAPSNTTTVGEVRGDIMNLMYIELGVALVLFASALIYFPSAPPLPPTPSSTVPRRHFADGYRAILRNGTFWLLIVSFGIFSGVSGSWISVITFSLLQFGFQQAEIGYLGLYVALSMGLVTVGSAFMADKFYGRLKLALLLLMLLSSLSYLWFMLMTIGVIAPSKAQVYLTVIAGQSFNFAAMPFFYELCCESAYPTPETVTGTLGALANNLVAFLFLAIFYIPTVADSGPSWMTYLLLGSNFGMMVPVLLTKEEYRRSRLDRDNL